jgi:hypothetical protein
MKNLLFAEKAGAWPEDEWIAAYSDHQPLTSPSVLP